MPHTEKPSSSSGQLLTIEKASLGLKNTSEKFRFLQQSHIRGLHCERLAYLYFRKRGYSFLSHRLKTTWAEIDLVLRSPKGVISLVEVKSVHSWDYIQTRVSQRQKTKLLRAYAEFAEKEGQCLLMLALVNSRDEVLVFDDVFR